MMIIQKCNVKLTQISMNALKIVAQISAQHREYKPQMHMINL